MKKLALLIAIASICFGCGQNAPKNQKADMNNPVIETIMSRRSIRHYTDQPVARELLQKIAECGVNAPNAMNRQQWEVRIIDSPDYFDGLTKVLDGTAPFLSSDGDPKYRNCLRNATAAIAVACPDDESGMCLVNVGLLCENVCLAAKSLGLGSVVMAGPVMMMNSIPEAKPFIDRLGFSEGYKLRIIVGLGYPDEDPEAKPRDLGKIKFVD
ncbi:MAG: nitroreductase family protein [Bacteroidales bacterium]|nr:nitroreductase family protein [Bacteroidales bacterium]MBQ6082199.1 nitroreductase family protein [Bacteroidales bacterium]